MINIIGVLPDDTVETDVKVTEENLKRYKWYWVDFSDPSADEFRLLDSVFHFHPLAIEDCGILLQRPKLDYYDGYDFYVTHIAKQEAKEIIKEELDFFVGPNYIVTFHFEESKEVEQVWSRITNQAAIEKWDPYYIFYQTLDKLVDAYFPLIYTIEAKLDVIEDNRQNQSMDELMDELFDIRHMLLHIRQTVNPMRDLLYRMLNSQHLTEVKNRREYFSDIYDHLLKVSEMVSSNREITTDIRDNYLSMTSHQSNEVMKILTIITSIFTPLTLISGIYGMNFVNMPELEWRYSYYVVLTVMLIIGLSLFFWFKKKGWFD
ncbi:magnesium transporter [Alkalibacterium putridalgicola]|uniref:Magnesium transport protein CorA n=1 Tax=Alkalibacterium putridalgicola TaxID=426703 RepID=A0A1H7W1I8_9LACT|nr:magnesium/cobalt transporter CorA [Alkalibacterium putridalgicola]GEK88657.1 putative metal ion transporter YfjQ [Alkalibacterium putridalgicola]SEM15353.1 magnesium transporter [Alkalibacterium putridalgicola]